MGADVRLLATLVLLPLTAASARVHTVLLTPSTPSPAWLPDAQAVNFTLAAGRARARVVQSSRAAPCAPLVHGFARALDAGAPFFLWQPSSATPEGGAEEVWFYLDGDCPLEDGQGQSREGKKLARRKDLDWAQLWGIVLGIAFGLVALAAFACCSWCCCFQHRVRAHQARLHVRDEGVQTAGAQHELPLYERRVRDGEVQLEEAPAPDYHLATRSRAVAPEDVPHPSGEMPAAPAEVPLPPSPQVQEMATSSAESRHPPESMSTSPRDPPMQLPNASSPPPPPPDDLPPAYSHAPPQP